MTIYEKALEKHADWQGKISTELKMPLEAAGGTKLTSSYWSSNHYAYPNDRYTNYALIGNTNNAYWTEKYRTYSVCAIRAF